MSADTKPIDWDKLDATTWSWQKAMGGEAAHGMLVLSPRAVERIEHHRDDHPVPHEGHGVSVRHPQEEMLGEAIERIIPVQEREDAEGGEDPDPGPEIAAQVHRVFLLVAK